MTLLEKEKNRKKTTDDTDKCRQHTKKNKKQL
jgi:hypothetical protein